jgi:hypothetical protein
MRADLVDGRVVALSEDFISDGTVTLIRVRPDGVVTNRSRLAPADALAVLLRDKTRVALTTEQAERLVQMRHARWNGSDVVEGERPSLPLEVLRDQAKAQIDRAAELARAAWVTPGTGQAMEYARTGAEAEALRVAGHGDDDAALYPMLAAEAAALRAAGQEVSLAGIAAGVLRRIAECDEALAAIKQVRLHAKTQVDQATAPGDILAVTQALVWPVPGR